MVTPPEKSPRGLEAASRDKKGTTPRVSASDTAAIANEPRFANDTQERLARKPAQRKGAPRRPQGERARERRAGAASVPPEVTSRGRQPYPDMSLNPGGAPSERLATKPAQGQGATSVHPKDAPRNRQHLRRGHQNRVASSMPAAATQNSLDLAKTPSERLTRKLAQGEGATSARHTQHLRREQQNRVASSMPAAAAQSSLNLAKTPSERLARKLAHGEGATSAHPKDAPRDRQHLRREQHNRVATSLHAAPEIATQSNLDPTPDARLEVMRNAQGNGAEMAPRHGSAGPANHGSRQIGNPGTKMASERMARKVAQGEGANLHSHRSSDERASEKRAAASSAHRKVVSHDRQQLHREQQKRGTAAHATTPEVDSVVPQNKQPSNFEPGQMRHPVVGAVQVAGPGRPVRQPSEDSLIGACAQIGYPSIAVHTPEVVDATDVKEIGPDDDDDNDDYGSRDTRIRRLAVGFAVVAVLVAIGLGVGLGLTRTSSAPTTVDSSYTCDDINERQTWIGMGEIKEDENITEFHIYFLNGFTHPALRAFGFATSLSDDGNRLAVGDRFGSSFQVYERSSRTNAEGDKASWDLLGSVIPPLHEFELNRPEEMDKQNSNVALSGNGQVIACGFPFYRTDYDGDAKYERRGAVLVYRYDSGSWVQQGEAFIGSRDKDYIGRYLSVSEDGNRLALGEPNYDRENGDEGRVRLFEFTAGKWTQLGDDIVGETAGEHFGAGVDLSQDGSVFAAGALFDDEGYAKVFRYVDTRLGWMQVGETLHGEEGYSCYGWPVSISGDGKRLAVGSSSYLSDCDVDEGNDKGYVRVYAYANETWSQLGDGVEGIQGGDGLGWSLSLSADGTTFAAGAPNSDMGGSEKGYAAVYRYHCGNWKQMGKEILGTAVDGWSGMSVSLSRSGEQLVIGTPFDYSGRHGSPGYVKVYQSPFD